LRCLYIHAKQNKFKIINKSWEIYTRAIATLTMKKGSQMIRQKDPKRWAFLKVKC